ncbi:hypothetical protein G6F56_001245 [Rhizopus delemar]|uniref:DNA-binding transcription factor yap1 n=1 Tax=Rhizopus stolonifer TaxID=4846 RepID=A0A367KRF1_RHIST|nr:hypothetical protein G6F56_001245 [Rhizopus delemar]RCI04751.1 DNA-binding transcription factor yap1 [Rhizopus stolonifer]
MKKDNQKEAITLKESPESLGTIQLTSGRKSPVNEKRGWEETFTVAEKKALEGNIVKAAKDNDGETYVTLQQEEFLLMNKEDQEDDDSQYSDESGSRKPGRKPLPDEEVSDSEQDPKVKRKAQNRVAQRAFRERKERYVRELEVKLKETQESNMITTAQLVRENHTLRSFIYRLEVENHALKGIPYPTPRYENNQTNSPYPNIAPLLPFCLPSPKSSDGPASPPSQSNRTSQSPSRKSSQSPSRKSSQSPSRKSTQPLEYTFSISTPASLKPANSSSPNVNKKQVIEPVPLYPPDNLPKTSKSFDQEEFCQRLSAKVCDEAMDRLLNEPLFDTLGKLNLEPFELFQPQKTDKAPEIWTTLKEHPQFEKSSQEKVFRAVKDLAISSDEGPLLEEGDLKDILSRMEQGSFFI